MDQSTPANKRIDSAAQMLLLIYTAECVFGSSGRWLVFGPLSIRMILFILAFSASLPAVFRKLKQLVLNGQVVITVCFGVWICVCAGIGFANGNNPGFIWSDISVLLSLALVPGFMAVMCNHDAIRRLINTVFWTATVVAGATVSFHFLCVVLSGEAVNNVNIWLNKASLGGMSLLQTGIFRLYMKSQIYFQVAIVYGVWKIGVTPVSRRWVLFLSEGILLCACILSYTRGFWLGLVASAMILLLMEVKHWKFFFRVSRNMLAVFAVFVMFSTALYQEPSVMIEIVNRLDPTLIVISEPKDDADDSEKSDSDGEDNSSGLSKDKEIDKEPDKKPNSDNRVDESNLAAVQVRQESLRLHKVRIKERPLIGHGLGENLDEIRVDGRTEYMYLDMMMKTGAIGLILFLLTFFSFLCRQLIVTAKVRNTQTCLSNWHNPMIRNRFLTAAYLGVTVTSFFNPFLINPLGITLLLITSTAVYSEELTVQ